MRIRAGSIIYKEFEPLTKNEIFVLTLLIQHNKKNGGASCDDSPFAERFGLKIKDIVEQTSLSTVSVENILQNLIEKWKVSRQYTTFFSKVDEAEDLSKIQMHVMYEYNGSFFETREEAEQFKIDTQ